MLQLYEAWRYNVVGKFEFQSLFLLFANRLQNRIWQRDARDRPAVQPESIYIPHLQPPPSYLDNPINAVTTKFVKTATNKMRCPIFTLAWTPEGRRLVTGASSGEFTLWNGLTFNFETILQVKCNWLTIWIIHCMYK